MNEIIECIISAAIFAGAIIAYLAWYNHMIKCLFNKDEDKDNNK